MKIAQTIMLSSLTAIALLTVGCGDSTSSTASSDTTTPSSTFTVERGPILGATVVDANGTEARELENGQYVFDQSVEYPVTSTGGYIDVNRNGTIDAGELENTLTLITTEGNVVTLATTLSSNEALKTFLETDLDINSSTLMEKLPDNDKSIEALSDTMFKYAIENNISNLAQITTQEMSQLTHEYTSLYESYLGDNLEAKEHEANLIDTMSIVTLDDAQATAARLEIENKLSFNDQESSSEDDNSTQSDENQESTGESDNPAQPDATQESAGEGDNPTQPDANQESAGESDNPTQPDANQESAGESNNPFQVDTDDETSSEDDNSTQSSSTEESSEDESGDDESTTTTPVTPTQGF